MSNKVHICAEIGSNHCGSLDLAFAHMYAAKTAGADSVKFQLFRAETLDARPEVQQILRQYEVPFEWIPKLRAKAQEWDIGFGVTPFAVDLVEPLRGQVDFVKISAYDLTFDDLLRAAATLEVPVVLSTAMATAKEVRHACDVFNEKRIFPTLLHGVAAYPARLADLNFLAMMLQPLFHRVGLSDHTHGSEAAIIATALGATWIEKHFRLHTEIPRSSKLYTARAAQWIEEHFRLHTDTSQSPDYGVSAHPQEFAAMVQAIRRTKVALGTGDKRGPLPCEMALYTTCRRTNDKRVRG